MKRDLKISKYNLIISNKEGTINIIRKKKMMKISLSILILYVVYIFLFYIQTSSIYEIKNSIVPFLILMGFMLLKEGTEEIQISNSCLLIKKFFLRCCYSNKKIPNNKLKAIFYERTLEEDLFTSVFCIESEILKNLHFRILNNEFEDIVISYGVDLSESEYLKIAESLKKFFLENEIEIKLDDYTVI